MEKSIAVLFFSFLLLGTGCSPKGKDTKEKDPEKALYDQVMDIHDEVMPSMSELYKLKRELSKKIENSPDLVEAKRIEMESTILLLDSANRGMMKWMNDFSPEDYTSKEELHRYLEDEIVRVQRMKETMLTALEKGRQVNQ